MGQANLRSYYCQELKKVTDSKKSGTGTDEVYTSKWCHFESLDSFLRALVIPRRSTTNHLVSYYFIFFCTKYTSIKLHSTAMELVHQNYNSHRVHHVRLLLPMLCDFLPGATVQPFQAHSVFIQPELQSQCQCFLDPCIRWAYIGL